MRSRSLVSKYFMGILRRHHTPKREVLNNYTPIDISKCDIKCIAALENVYEGRIDGQYIFAYKVLEEEQGYIKDILNIFGIRYRVYKDIIYFAGSNKQISNMIKYFWSSYGPISISFNGKITEYLKQYEGIYLNLYGNTNDYNISYRENNYTIKGGKYQELVIQDEFIDIKPIEDLFGIYFYKSLSYPTYKTIPELKIILSDKNDDSYEKNIYNQYIKNNNSINYKVLVDEENESFDSSIDELI